MTAAKRSRDETEDALAFTTAEATASSTTTSTSSSATTTPMQTLEQSPKKNKTDGEEKATNGDAVPTWDPNREQTMRDGEEALVAAESVLDFGDDEGTRPTPTWCMSSMDY